MSTQQPDSVDFIFHGITAALVVVSLVVLSPVLIPLYCLGRLLHWCGWRAESLG